MKHKYILLLALFLISLFSSLTLLLSPVEEICNIEEGCSIVQHSSYAKTLGIENSVFGVAIFSLLIFLTLWQIRKPNKYNWRVIKISTIIGSLVAIYFLYLQQFVLGAYCKYCLVIDLSLLLALFLVLFNRKN